MIVAVDLNNGIGKNGTIPWKIPDDLKRFSKLTKGSGNNAMIMGRKTWESLPKKPLPFRDNLILSSTISIEENSPKNSLAKSFKDVNELINFCEEQKYEEVWIIGGAQIYDLFYKLDIINYIYITRIFKNYKCDTFFRICLMWLKSISFSSIKLEDNTVITYDIYSNKS